MTDREALRALLDRHEKMLAVENPEDCPCSMSSTAHAEAIRELDAAREVLARPEPTIVMYACDGVCGHLFGQQSALAGQCIACTQGRIRPLRWADEG